MHWSIVAIAAYLANAAAALTDKFLLRRLVPHPAVLAFFVSLMGAAVVVMAPFVLRDAAPPVLGASAFSGLAFAAGLYLYYTALKGHEASRVVPLVGGMVPIFVFAFARLLLGEALAPPQLAGFALVIAGTALLAEEGNAARRLEFRAIALGFFAAALFAASHVAAKYVYLVHPFASGLVWRGFGGFLAALVIFLIPTNRRRIVAELTDREVKTEGVVLLSQGFSGAGFLLFNYALSLGPVTLVNALSGVQYVFLFLATVVLSRLAPGIVRESRSRRELTFKSIGIAMVALGIAIIFIA